LLITIRAAEDRQNVAPISVQAEQKLSAREMVGAGRQEGGINRKKG
jgi:hypothetical protein